MGESKRKRVIGPILECLSCLRDGVRDHSPQEDEFCCACGTPFSHGCPAEHHHQYWCIDISDIRVLACGHFGHKECQKQGGHCWHIVPT